jgi:flagellin
MIINHNMNAMNAHRNMSSNNVNAGRSMEKLSSGLRINRAGDDAAGLAISEKMRGQIRGLDQAGRNAQDGISMLQTAEGALNETHSILQRMRELGVQASNDTNNESDRGEIQKEINQLTSEINRIGESTEFNTQKLMNSTATGGFTATFQVGANNGQTFQIDILNMKAESLGLASTTTGGHSVVTGANPKATAVTGASFGASTTAGVTDGTQTSATLYALDLSDNAKATAAIEVINNAIEGVSAERSKLGAFQNRLEHTINNLGTASENLTSAESRIRDVDMAKEMMNFSKNNILSQAAQAMLAQANQQPQGVLQLLR